MRIPLVTVLVVLYSFTTSAQNQVEDINMINYLLKFSSSSGGNKRIQSFGGNRSTWLFKSRFDNITLDAGENSNNNRRILFLIGGVEKARFKTNGSLGLGTVTTGPHKLAVEGSIGAREVKVQASGWSDFVFEKDYNLPTLEEVSNHIAQNGHLKDIPSAAEVEKEGIFLGEMDSKLLQKIEELMLYTIEQEEKIDAQNQVIQKLSNRLEVLEHKLKTYKN